jgi:hypothetical protein
VPSKVAQYRLPALTLLLHRQLIFSIERDPHRDTIGNLNKVNYSELKHPSFQ